METFELRDDEVDYLRYLKKKQSTKGKAGNIQDETDSHLDLSYL